MRIWCAFASFCRMGADDWGIAGSATNIPRLPTSAIIKVAAFLLTSVSPLLKLIYIFCTVSTGSLKAPVPRRRVLGKCGRAFATAGAHKHEILGLDAHCN